jgi:NitT/TauT family transport system ATP-binding protein
LALTPHPGRLAAEFDVPEDTSERGTAKFAALESHIQRSVFAETGSGHA